MKSLLALLALFACAVLPLHAADVSDLTYTTDDERVTITDCDGNASGELLIPDTIEGNTVTEIGSGAFNACASLTSITIPEGVTSIGERAFSNCASLTSITIPAGITIISNSTFSGCTSLASITIPEDVTSVGERAFANCTNLTSITIPEGVTSVGENTFSSCASLTSVTIPDTVTEIGSGAFIGCASLTSITVPDSVTSIEENAFRECTNLTGITFLGSAPTVGDLAFDNLADGAQAIVTPGERASFGDAGSLWNGLLIVDCMDALCILTWSTTDGTVIITDCYENASGELLIPDTIEGNTVTEIGSNAFSNCISLTSVTIPVGVTVIDTSAFENCTSLTGVTIPDSVTRIESSAFAECSSMTSVTFGENSALTYIGDSAFTECSSLTSVTIPDRVTMINGSTFYECTSLTTVKMGRSVYEVDSGAFQNCINLSEVEFPMGAPSDVHVTSFLNIAIGARAVVLPEYSSSFGTLESNLFNFTPVWNNLIVADGEEVPAPCTLEQLQQLNTRVGDLQASIEEKDEQIAELSQRPPVEELQEVRTGSLVLSADQETNLVTLEFEIQESENLRDWVSRPEKVTTTLPLEEGKKFVRIALRK
ncbi:MAG: leucine-rich repeat domain-containing protein [Pseudomonadales bacterium]|nr:leucine-rich repeat domain-containing protein [Pseudomonadales bacterium]